MVNRWGLAARLALETLLLASCVATAAIFGETAVLAVAEGHHLSELAAQGEAYRLWGGYGLAFGIVALVASGLLLPLALAGPRGRRAQLVGVLAALAVPTIWGVFSLRAGILDVVIQPPLVLVLGLALLLGVTWLGFAILARSVGPYRRTLPLIVAGLLAGPAAGTFAVQRLPSEVLSAKGIAILGLLGVVGLALALPLVRSLIAERPRLRAPFGVTVGLGLAFLGLVLSGPWWRSELRAAEPGAAGATSVLLLVTDTLRADMAADPREAPNLARLSGEALVWERAYATASWTIPSFASLLTSTLPSEHGAGRTDPALGHKRSLRGGLPNLAETLQGAGYSTLAVLSNPTLSPRYGLVPGFDQYENLLNPQWYHPIAFGLRSRRLPRWLMPKELAYMRAPTQTRRILAAVDRARDAGRPFFVLGHYMDPHEPYAAPERYHREEEGLAEIERAYRAEVRFFDEELGRLMEGLREDGVYDELLIVFTSDHGEELTESRTERNVRHGHTLFEELIRVPLLVKLPGSGAHARRREPVSLVDVAPTILDVLGLERPEGFRGRSLLASPDDRRILFAEGMIEPPEQKAAVRGSHKALAREVPAGADGIELYDLARDPEEQRPMDPARAREDGFETLIEALRAHVRATATPKAEEGSDAVVADPALRQQLEALGYAQ